MNPPKSLRRAASQFVEQYRFCASLDTQNLAGEFASWMRANRVAEIQAKYWGNDYGFTVARMSLITVRGDQYPAKRFRTGFELIISGFFKEILESVVYKASDVILKVCGTIVFGCNGHVTISAKDTFARTETFSYSFEEILGADRLQELVICLLKHKEASVAVELSLDWQDDRVHVLSAHVFVFNHPFPPDELEQQARVCADLALVHAPVARQGLYKVIVTVSLIEPSPFMTSASITYCRFHVEEQSRTRVYESL